MGLRTPAEYVDSLRDGRTVFYRGERVPDVTVHPVIAKAVRHACVDYEMAEDAETRELAVVADEGEPYARYFKVPRSTDDLRLRSQLIEASTARGRTLVPLVKEIGTDALFGLMRVTRAMDAARGTDYRERVDAFHRHCRDHDLTISVAQTDVKGDRSAGPGGQPHPDYYLRIVERRPDGIVVRGAKAHTSCTTNVNEVIALPTRAMGEGGRGLRRGLRRARRYARPHAGGQPLRRGRAQRLRGAPQRGPQDDGDDHHLRRRVRAQRARVHGRGARVHGAAGARLRRVPPLHRRLLQAAAGGRAGGRGPAAGRPERHRARGALCARSWCGW